VQNAKLANATGNSPSVQLRLTRPDGSFVASGEVGAQTTDGLVMIGALMDVPGSWVLELTPFGATTATLGVQLALLADRDQTAVVGQPAPVTLDTVGQDVAVHVDLVAGARLGLQSLGATFDSLASSASLRLLRPDGTAFYGTTIQAGSSFRETAVPLDVTGSWTLMVRLGGSSGAFTLLLTTITDVSTALTVGTPTTVDFTEPGQVRRLTGSGWPCIRPPVRSARR
jgi:hypothetical protein